jgi:predicted phage terminase large subunit-like protein
MACQGGEIKRLIINIPPRFLKSITVSVAWPAWLLGHNPGEQILCASYSKELAMTHSVNCRNVIESDWYRALFPRTILAADQNTKNKFKTTEGGCRYAVGVGGTITGEGGNFILMDDLISAKESNSRVVREEANNFIGQTAHNRLNDKHNGVMALIMQRLHNNDPTGYLMEQGGWEMLKIPVEFKHDTVFKIGSFYHEAKEGDVLSPTFMDKDAIEREKRIAGSYNFSAQFMQEPSPEGGGEFRLEWLKHYKGKLQANSFNTYITVDPANSKKETSDYTAICVIGLGADENIYLLDLIRDKLNLRERQETLFKLHAKYKPKAVLYEKYGLQVDIDAMNEAMNYNNYRFTITEVGGKMSKEDRIRRLIPYFADNRIYLPETLYKTDYSGVVIDLIDEFINEEYLSFPVGRHDDCIDALSRILDHTLIWPGEGTFDYYKFAAGFPDSASPRR